MQSETADSVAWERYAAPGVRDTSDPILAEALSRISFTELATPVPLHAVVQHSAASNLDSERRLLVVLGRSRRMAVEDHHQELKEMAHDGGEHVGTDVRKTIGDVASAFVMSRLQAGILVMQASAISASE
jgi:hypothetical protein